MFYIIETLLPFSIRLPLQETIEFTFNQYRCGFVHLERISMLHGGIQIPDTSYIPADKYGLYFRSKVLLILTDNIIEELRRRESSELQNLFDLDAYVSHCFGLHGTKAKSFAVGAINYFLSIYRILSQDWHVTPVAPKDLTNIVLSKDEDGKVTFLSRLEFLHQTVFTTGQDILADQKLELLKYSVMTGGSMSPLVTMEADIHDKATQGDFIPATISIGLLAEEAIKEHVVQYYRHKEGLDVDDAQRKLIKPTGHTFGIADLLDRPKGKRTCFIEDIIGWKPYQENAYEKWNKYVRNLRNDVIHSGKKDINFDDINKGWKACYDIVSISSGKFIEAVQSHDITLTDGEKMSFYRPISVNVCPPSLRSDFNAIGH